MSFLITHAYSAHPGSAPHSFKLVSCPAHAVGWHWSRDRQTNRKTTVTLMHAEARRELINIIAHKLRLFYIKYYFGIIYIRYMLQ